MVILGLWGGDLKTFKCVCVSDVLFLIRKFFCKLEDLKSKTKGHCECFARIVSCSKHLFSHGFGCWLASKFKAAR